MRPPAPALDVIASQGKSPQSASGAAATTATGQAGSSSTPQGLVPPAAAADTESRDSRSSSSTNSPVPRDNDESDFYLANNDSESSLGVVPNLQDMQVNDQACLPAASTLPSEILISIFARLSSTSDLFRCMLVSKRWARNVVEMLWHRPTCTTWAKHSKICQTLQSENPTFAYPEFIKRLNLAALNDVNDGSVIPLAVCTRVERLTLTNCKAITDVGLMELVRNSPHLLALDISQDAKITEASIFTIANSCPRLQGLNVTSCKLISDDSMVELAKRCRFIKRLKLNDCDQLTDRSVLAFAQQCPNILEIDLHSCRNIGNEPVTALLAKGQSLRELRLANCDLIDDSAFLSLPANRIYEHLRILDLTCCARLTDRAVERIIDVAPRLRNLVLAKCGNITDAAVYAISRLGKNLHYVHLGHCRNITDDAVKRLVHCCNRIRYIDLGCCTHLTDESVTRLATLPKLKRIGLVKCSNITDESMYALAKANARPRSRRDAQGNVISDLHYGSSLERVHLSYCVNLTLPSIIRLLNACPKLTHLSLTGVTAFLREDLEKFCREAPADFTEHQRQVFCVFSGPGVTGLKHFLNNKPEFAAYHAPHAPNPPVQLDMEEENDVVEDDDMGDGSEIALGPDNEEAQNPNTMPIPPPPLPPLHQTNGWLQPAVDQAATSQSAPTNSTVFTHHTPPLAALDNLAASATAAAATDSTTPTQEDAVNHSLATFLAQSPHDDVFNPSLVTFLQQPSQGAGPSTAGANPHGGPGQADAGPSTASFHAQPEDQNGQID